MAISYAGLPGKRCSTCSGGLFARFGNVLRCGQCQPPAADERPDEWLESAYERGVMRWSLSLPPSPPVVATLWLYVADNLDWIEIEPSDHVADVWYANGRWHRKLDRSLLGWLNSRVWALERQTFAETFQEALMALREVVARGVEVGVFGEEFSDESRWPRSSLAFEPFSGLFDPAQITFPLSALASSGETRK